MHHALAPLATTLAALALAAAPLARAGELDPPSGPVAPSMHSLTSLIPSIPIPAIPAFITQPGAYHLTGNLTGAPGLDGITIDCAAPGHVLIDLRGFTIASPPTAETAILIAGTNLTDVTIQNGHLRGGKRLTKAQIIPERAVVRPLQDKLLALHLADCELDAVTSEGHRVLTVEDCTITGAGGHAIYADTAMAIIRKIGIHSVGGDGIHIPPAPATRQTREHVLLARQVSITAVGGSGVKASDTPQGITQNIKIIDAGADGIHLGDDADASELSIDGVAGHALIAGQRLRLRDSRLVGSVLTGAAADVQHTTLELDIDAGQSATFSGGNHEIAHNLGNIHGAAYANLPAISILGDASSITHNHVLVVDPPPGPPVAAAAGISPYRNPPHYMLWTGGLVHYSHNTVQGIHPGTEALVASGDACVITDNTICGAVPSTPGSGAIGIIFSGNRSLIARNTFSGLGPAGNPMLITGAGHALAPTVTPATLPGNCNPDRNLHVPN